MNSLYRNVMIERIRHALAAARAVSPLEHAGTKGAVREVLIADLFRPLLPADVGVVTGVVISADDEQSSQQDIILFDRRIVPPVLFEHGPGLVPVESALICIEVKTTLTATELRNAHEGAESVQRLRLRSGIRNEAGQFVDVKATAPMSYVLALDTDLTATNEGDRYRKLLAGQAPTTLRVICIAGHSVSWATERYVYDRKANTKARDDGLPLTGEWKTMHGDANHSEMLKLIASIQERVNGVAATRGQPPLRAYLLE